jgi:hypothetical protein
LVGGLRVGFVVIAAGVGACSVLVDTSNLSAEGGDNAGGDSGVVEAGDAVAPLGREDAGGDGSTIGACDGFDAAVGSGGPCTVASVQAVPGTTVYQVMQQRATAIQTITETSGDLLVVIAYGGQGPGQTTPPTSAPNQTFSVTDTLGNTYYAAPMVENDRSHQAALQIFYAPNILGGPNRVTVTQAAAPPVVLWTGVLLQEYSGAAATDVVDVANARMAPGSSTAVSAGPLTTRTCGLVVGAFTDGHVSGQSLAPLSGWTKRSTDEWDPGGAVDNAPAGALGGSSVNAGMNLSGGPDDGWVAEQVVFRAATTVARAQPDTLGFLTPPRTVNARTCSQAIVVESRKCGVAATTSTGVRGTLSGAGVSFYADSASTFPTTSIFIGAGTSSQPVFFKAASAGSPAITVAAPGFPVATQNETIK